LSSPKGDGGLGFCDLYVLAKQAWRLLENPNSLCGRVLKARYFPNNSVLEATPTPGISYTWRSIVKGINLLKEGLVWRVGDGRNVQMWSDPWIPREGSRLPITPRRQNALTHVHELIDPHTGSWDALLVEDIFWPIDAQAILKIPLREGFEDFPA
jgi:hypothetical protein